jgi:hypothetical protein
VLGVIGNPISHSRSPLLHNAALATSNADIVYVPLLVDDLRDFLASPLFGGADFMGFSVTIPHKETALACCDEARALVFLPAPQPFCEPTYSRGTAPFAHRRCRRTFCRAG